MFKFLRVDGAVQFGWGIIGEGVLIGIDEVFIIVVVVEELVAVDSELELLFTSFSISVILLDLLG